MPARAKPKQSLVGIELVRLLAQEGDRVFTTDRARELAPRVGMKEAYLGESLYHLRRNGWIVPLRRGLHALSSTVPGVAAAHEFEIATALVSPAMVSHWSAMSHHGLTEQVPWDVFVLTTAGSWLPRARKDVGGRSGGGYPVRGVTYRFARVRPDRFFGAERVWVGDARVRISDLERTLLDGMCMPRHCGDFSEVIHAFGVALDRLDMDRITEYGIRLGVTTAKRLGWVLEAHGVARGDLERLSALPISGYRRLDPTGPAKGPCNSRWMVQENLAGRVAT